MYIKTKIYDFISESWYHGTPDSSELVKKGQFEERFTTAPYITDLEKYNNLVDKMDSVRNTDRKKYFKLLNKLDSFKNNFRYKKPVFLTDKYSVAKTYADPKRAFDYQGAIENVFEVDVECDDIVKIYAHGDRFRFIDVDKVKRGFINAGISEEEIEEVIEKFNFYKKGKSGIQTDLIAAIGQWFGFDCIDVVGVLDSYRGGTVKSTVRMVLNPEKIKIK